MTKKSLIKLRLNNSIVYKLDQNKKIKTHQLFRVSVLNLNINISRFSPHVVHGQFFSLKRIRIQ